MSMSFSAFLAIFMCGIASCVLISVVIIRYNHRHAFDNSRNRITAYVSELSEAVEINGNVLELTDYTKTELEVLAQTYGGRVFLVNSNLSVVYDSYQTKNNVKLILPGMVECLGGEEIFRADFETRSATVILPINKRSKEGAAGAFLMVYPINEEVARYHTSRRMLLLLCLCAGIIIFAIAVARAYFLVRPLHVIRSELNRINEGNVDDRLDVHNNMEASGISNSVNTLLERARETEETRRNFVSDVSHELKTPMTSMKVLSEALLLSGDNLPQTVREFLTDINTEIDRENHIISDLLALARMDKKTDTLRIERTRVNELLDVILKRVRPLAQDHEVEVVYESYRDVVAEVDGPKIVTALTNIVENAILYNRPQGSVYVTLNANMSHFFVTVQDTGFGIAEADIAHIFERFYRVDKDRSRETGGTGLGLAITKEIVVAHGGQIKAYSKENEGTTISVRIPLTRAPKSGRKA